MDEQPNLPPMQFGTRTMLTLMIGVSLVLAIGNWAGPAWAITAGWLLMLIVVHVLANSWGQRTYRPGAPRPKCDPPSPWTHAPDAAEKIQFQTANRLAQIRIGRFNVVVTLLGFVCGLAGGAYVGLSWFNLANPTALNGVIVVTGSSGVLGGLLSFWSSSFLEAMLRYLVAAHEGSKPGRRDER